MKIFITGAKGFIGRNLVDKLRKNKKLKIFECDRDTAPQTLRYYTRECDFLFHLAAVHRPEDESELEKVNHLFFADLLKMLRLSNNLCPVLLSSSIQAGYDSAYGRSKLAAEKKLREHASLLGTRAIIYRLTNTFGRYAKPNHHSVVATFCYNIARGLPIMINDPARKMKLCYIDDVIDSFIPHITNHLEPFSDDFYRLSAELEYEVTLGELADKIYLIKSRIDKDLLLDNPDELTKKLYKTYQGYLVTQVEE